jgi:hypothetical protein
MPDDKRLIEDYLPIVNSAWRPLARKGSTKDRSLPSIFGGLADRWLLVELQFMQLWCPRLTALTAERRSEN